MAGRCGRLHNPERSGAFRKKFHIGTAIFGFGVASAAAILRPLLLCKQANTHRLCRYGKKDPEADQQNGG
jgi:hypothetical protein